MNDLDGELLGQVLAGLWDRVTILDRSHAVIYRDPRSDAPPPHSSTGCDCLREGDEEDCGLQLAFEAGRTTRSRRSSVDAKGRTAAWESRYLPLRDGSGAIVAVAEVSRDVTECQALHETVAARSDELQQVAQEYRTLLDHLPDFVVRYDRQLRRAYVNPAWERAAGLSADEVVGVAASRIPKVRRPVNAVYASKLREAFATGQEQACSFAWENAAGVTLYLDYVLVPELDEAGEVVNVLAVGRDLTERRRIEQQLRHARKMEALGQLAGGLAHDFNNMLGVIMSCAELALEQASPTPSTRTHLEEIRTAAERSAALTRQLLALARSQPVLPSVVDLNETVARMLRMLRLLLGASIELDWRPAPGLCRVRVDPTEVDRILANLCVNARDAIDGAGTVVIETRSATVARSDGGPEPERPTGEFVVLAVRDDGPGMDEAVLRRVFDPFFTTKAPGRGTGLGLATVAGSVRRSGGFVDVESEPGKGTTFRLYFPCHGADADADSVAESAPKASCATGFARGAETVLLVDDEPHLRRITGLVLQQHGYRVLSAGSPTEALTLAEQHTGEFDLVVTDIVMSEMTGTELVRRLGAAAPGLPYLFMSGYSADAATETGDEVEPSHLLEKPFAASSLLAKVREALDRA